MIAAELERALGVAVDRLEPVSGGDINDAHRAWLADGSSVFVKSCETAAAGSFAAEAASLRWLAGANTELGVPEVLAVDDRFLALGWIDAGWGDPESFARGLAALHKAGAPEHGARPPGVSGGISFGSVALPDVRADRWTTVYAEGRLAPLARRARDSGALSAKGAAAVDRVCERIDRLGGPAEPPCRLHGDLWSGNVMAGSDGRAYLIDPVAYGGHREVDLAMMELFGGAEPGFLDAYKEAYPLAEGYLDRVGLWQLFPLLVHTLLFGGGYGAQVETVARAYAG